ncbi:MAG: LuxR C-terminal-related transcriptional regulator [Solirubrobacteraceae bacterium]
MTTVSGARSRRRDLASPRERELSNRLAALVADAHDILGVDVPFSEEAEATLKRAAPALTAIAVTAAEQIRASAPDSSRMPEITDLALRNADLYAELSESALTRRRRALAGVESALGRMRCMSTADELIQAVCPELVRSCGFTRVMLSRVVDETWMAWIAHFAHREIRDSDREWIANVRIPLNTMLLEREVLQQRTAAFTADARADPRTSKSFVEGCGTTSYAVAPILPAGPVVGFLHADYYPSTRPMDEIDCYVLDAFADAFGRAYERVVLVERLRTQRDHVRETLKTAESIMDNLAQAEIELARREDERSMINAAATASALGGEPPELDELLTRREREVLTLIAQGQSNGAIAERLLISEGTVKSHVSQILRKLGAVNRAELITLYLGMIGKP